MPNGMRSKFRAWDAQHTDHPHEVAEAVLAQVNGDQPETAYLPPTFFERRALMMQDWADFQGQLSSAQQANNFHHINARVVVG